jgi:hypothetical protein
MKKTTFTIFAGIAAILLTGCATRNAGHDSQRVRTAHVVPAAEISNSQETAFYWPLTPTLAP